MIHNITFTGREGCLTPKKVAKTVEEAAGYFKDSAPHGIAKTEAPKVAKVANLAEESYVLSHGNINAINTDSAKTANSIDFFG